MQALGSRTVVDVAVAAASRCWCTLRHASKVSGSATKYQARPSRDKNINFQVVLGTPTLKGSVIRRQRAVYETTKFHVREPDFHAGHNVDMHPTTYTLTARSAGVPTVRWSKISRGYRWVDIEPDIQKVHRSRQLREYYRQRGTLLAMNAYNEHYLEELHDLQEPDWRDRVMREMPLTERFPDPNLLTRGVVKSIAPKPRFYYE